LQSIGYFRTHFIDRRRRTDLATAVPILAGFFGVLARAPFFCPSLLRDSSSEPDNVRDGHKADGP